MSTLYLYFICWLMCSTTVQIEKGSEMQNEKKADSKYVIDSTLYPNFTKAMRVIHEKKLISLDVIRTFFCLNLGLNQDYDDLVLFHIESFFEIVGIHFGLFVFVKCIKRYQENLLNSKYSYDNYVRADYFDKNVDITLKKHVRIKKEKRQHLILILNDIYTNTSTIGKKVISHLFNDFVVSIKPFSKKQFKLIEKVETMKLLMFCYPRIFLNYEVRMNLYNLSKIILSMAKSDVTTDIKPQTIANYPEIQKYCAFTGPKETYILKSALFDKVYAEFYVFYKNNM